PAGATGARAETFGGRRRTWRWRSRVSRQAIDFAFDTSRRVAVPEIAGVRAHRVARGIARGTRERGRDAEIAPHRAGGDGGERRATLDDRVTDARDRERRLGRAQQGTFARDVTGARRAPCRGHLGVG